jgi:hypothetical protein
MIKTGFNYTAYSPKQTKSGKSMFSVMDKDKDGNKHYATIFCTNDVELYDKCKVRFVEFESFSLSEYKGKLQVAIFAKVELSDEAPKKNYVDEALTDPEPTINSDDLPF